MEWARWGPSIEGVEKALHDNYDDFVGGVHYNFDVNDYGMFRI